MSFKIFYLSKKKSLLTHPNFLTNVSHSLDLESKVLREVLREEISTPIKVLSYIKSIKLY